MLRVFLVAICAFLLALNPIAVPAQDSPDELAEMVEILTLDLDGDTLKQREGAEKKLIQLGPSVLDHLPPDNERTPAEMKARLERIRTVLEKVKADNAAKSTKVNLTLKDKPFTEVIAAIEKQTGNQFFDYRQNAGQQAATKTISVDWKDVPFWQATDELFSKAGLSPYHFSGTPGILAYQNGGMHSTKGVYYGEIFRFQPTRIEAYRNLLSGEDSNLYLNLQISWEPRVQPIVIEMPVDSLSIQDESGNELLSNRQGSLDTEIIRGVSAIDIQMPLGQVSRSSQMVKKLQGEVTALIPGRIESFEFNQLKTARNVRIDRGAIAIVLESFSANGDIWEANISVRLLDEQGALQSHRGWIYNNEAYLLGPNDERLEYAGIERTYEDVDTVGMSYKFVLDQGVDQYKFVYRSPASMVSLPVQFEMTDIPLP